VGERALGSTPDSSAGSISRVDPGLKTAKVKAMLRRDLQAIGCVRCVGDADNVLFETGAQTESEVASRLETLFGVNSVAVGAHAMRPGRERVVRAPVFEVIEASEWEAVQVVATGRRPKEWIVEPGSRRRALFKSVVHHPAEVAVERVAAEVGRLIGISAAETALGVRNGTQGILSFRNY
jgi:hypothetical protein